MNRKLIIGVLIGWALSVFVTPRDLLSRFRG